MEYSVLRHGKHMPIIGLGTYKTTVSDVVKTSIKNALSAGYRSIDTASGYRNEEDIGEALKSLSQQHNLKREDIFITSKLAPKDHGTGACYNSCLESIRRLNCDYLDMYLIHWPAKQGMKPEDDKHWQFRKESWLDMEKLVQQGKLKGIGVSNYLQRHIEELKEYCTILPSVLQVEYHPHLQQTELVKFCQQNDIHFQAYSSLGTTADDNKVLVDPTIIEIAAKNNKSPSQVLLRWAVQQGIGVIPKSTSKKHIEENIQIFDFELSDEDMQTISGLDQQHHYCWDPNKVK